MAITLYESKEQCCGCEACMNICPHGAISMEPDEYGFLYPAINSEKCVQCRLCERMCLYPAEWKTESPESPMESYAAVANDKAMLKESASGGIFAATATEVLAKGGVVFGCAMEFKEGRAQPGHAMITNLNGLSKLQGSKYVQSNISGTYSAAKSELDNGKSVLFSGTPCQIVGLRKFLMGKEYPHLLTIDIVCHGVPSAAFFRGYTAALSKQVDGLMVSFKFRDKSINSGYNFVAIYKRKDGAVRKKLIPAALSSYYDLFLKSEISRDSCYNCKYANSHRPGDLTIGDYWGLEKEHPDYLLKNNGDFDADKGVSCVIVNTEKGRTVIEALGNQISFKPTIFEKIAKHNNQLRMPTHYSDKRKQVLGLFRDEGYEGVERWFYMQLGFKRYLRKAWGLLPIKVQSFIVSLLSSRASD